MAKEALKDTVASLADENKVQEIKEGTKKSKAGNRRKTPQAPVYSAGELAAGAKKLFGTRPECVLAALRAAGKSECTVGKAKGIVEKFMKRVVQ